ncbi:MAG TPA: glycosyltransferase [Solirubrobacter sp.]
MRAAIPHRAPVSSRGELSVRVLILTADIGAGHDLPAALLADAIREREPDAYVVVADGLEAGGRGAQAVARSGMETILQHARPVFDLQYWLIARFGPTRRAGGVLAMALGARGLLKRIRRERPDVIVSTYPGTSEVLGRLRRMGRLPVPCVAAITDLAALHWWAHPGLDLHLMIHAESREEVERVAGPGADIRHVRGFSRPEFDAPPSREAARAALGLPLDRPIVVVSGGGWAVGDLAAATETVLARPDAIAVCLCGTNAGVRSRLSERFAREPRVRVEGFTDRMCEWLSAADVLVHSTAGLTMLEAQLCGTWAISYGWGIGHLRLNNRAYRRFGLAAVATTPPELAAALETALAAPRPRFAGYAALPTAADAVLELAARR